MRWLEKDGAERERPRTAQSFCVPKDDIAATGSYDLSFNRYREIEREEIEHTPPAEIIAELRVIEGEIFDSLAKLEGMIG